VSAWLVPEERVIQDVPHEFPLAIFIERQAEHMRTEAIVTIVLCLTEPAVPITESPRQNLLWFCNRKDDIKKFLGGINQISSCNILPPTVPNNYEIVSRGYDASSFGGICCPLAFSQHHAFKRRRKVISVREHHSYSNVVTFIQRVDPLLT
jgi:hypothetical protein